MFVIYPFHRVHHKQFDQLVYFQSQLMKSWEKDLKGQWIEELLTKLYFTLDLID